MVDRYLITTADERTWVDDQPILFLGEWCRIYNRKTQWESLDAVIAPYHWDNRTKLRKDYQYLKKLHETFLLDLSNKLNQLHQVNRSLRYWRILIGPWLGYFIQILFDRWTMLKFAIEEYSISGCSVLRREPSTIIPNNMEHFNRIIHEDYWNEGIFGQLLNNYWGKELLIQEKDLYTANDQLTENEKGSNKKRIKKLFDKIIFMTNSLSVKSDEYFFISSYLPYSIDFKLQLSLGQVPKNWRTELLNDIKVNKKMRQWEWDNQNSKDDFAAVVKCMIPKHIPKYYLEGYKTLINRVHSLPWPNKPKAIFTSNAYSGNDVFKAWAAEKTESGVPLVIGQHGGYFGIGEFSFVEDHQIEIADNWISWGWSSEKKPKIIPLGNLNTFGNQKISYNPKGYAILVEKLLPRYSFHIGSFPIASHSLNYLDDQFCFVDSLPESIRQKLLIRFGYDFEWGQKARWKARFPILNINEHKGSIENLIRRSRLCISTSNASSYLESLSWNVPTIVFWNKHHWELKKKAIPLINLLKDVGIFHETPESAAQHMISIWDDVVLWWESKEVQCARLEFCEQYSHTPQNPHNELKRIFNNLS